MLRVIDESKNIDLTAKFELGQEVYMTSYQGYRGGVITGISACGNDKGVVFVYNVEQYVSKKSAPKTRKCLEKHLFRTVKDALKALAEMADAKGETQQKAEQ